MTVVVVLNPLGLAASVYPTWFWHMSLMVLVAKGTLVVVGESNVCCNMNNHNCTPVLVEMSVVHHTCDVACLNVVGAYVPCNVQVVRRFWRKPHVWGSFVYTVVWCVVTHHQPTFLS